MDNMYFFLLLSFQLNILTSYMPKSVVLESSVKPSLSCTKLHELEAAQAGFDRRFQGRIQEF